MAAALSSLMPAPSAGVSNFGSQSRPLTRSVEGNALSVKGSSVSSAFGTGGQKQLQQWHTVGLVKKKVAVVVVKAQEGFVGQGESEYLEDLRVPQAWVDREVAATEAEWLRVALHQWLDDEYCPEPANEEISKRCSKVYYYCLLEQQLDVGDILMQMVRGLETFSFKESFHGAFSSANAAIYLITKRMRSVSLEEDSTVD